MMNEPNKNNSKSTIFAVVACVAFYFLYTQYMQKKYPNMYKDKVAQEAGQGQGQDAPNAAANSAANPSTSTPGGQEAKSNQSLASSDSNNSSGNDASGESDNYAPLSLDQLTLETEYNRYVFNQKDASLQEIIVKGYQQTINGETEVNLAQYPMIMQAYPYKLQGAASLQNLEGFHAERSSASSLLFHKTIGNFKLTYTYAITETEGQIKPGLAINYRVENLSNEPQNLHFSFQLKNRIVYPDVPEIWIPIPGMASERASAFLAYGEEFERFDLKAECDGESGFGNPLLTANNRNIDVLAYDLHYFMSAFLPQAQNLNFSIFTEGATQLNGEEESCTVVTVLDQDQGLLSPGASMEFAFNSFFGPKDMDKLDAFDAKLHQSIDLGWFDFIAGPLLMSVKWLYDLVGNYGIAIIIVTIILKILFYPLQKQAAISAHKMKKLNPKMKELREKFKDDPRRQQQELMKFMAQHKVNPMKGCIPILPTIPVFIAFWRMLSTSIELRHAPFYGWIHDLAAPDPYLILPIVLIVAYSVQQKMTPMTGMDKTQEKIMMLMPIFFGVMMMTLPSGLTLYMVANTLVTILLTYWINKRLEA